MTDIVKLKNIEHIKFQLPDLTLLQAFVDSPKTREAIEKAVTNISYTCSLEKLASTLRRQGERDLSVHIATGSSFTGRAAIGFIAAGNKLVFARETNLVIELYLKNYDSRRPGQAKNLWGLSLSGPFDNLFDYDLVSYDLTSDTPNVSLLNDVEFTPSKNTVHNKQGFDLSQDIIHRYFVDRAEKLNDIEAILSTFELAVDLPTDEEIKTLSSTVSVDTSTPVKDDIEQLPEEETKVVKPRKKRATKKKVVKKKTEDVATDATPETPSE